MNCTPTRYVVITPVRDEEKHLQSTIESMLRQTVRPCEWIIVNDGSTDGTATVIDRYVSRHPWIHAVHRADRGFRKSGGGVVDAFNDGLQSLSTLDWEFLVKLDGDLAFQPDYFERCFEMFARDSHLGVGGGAICYEDNGVKRFEEGPMFHVRGATKIYRRECWQAIGGFWPAPGWDSIDELKANMCGWNTRTFHQLHLIHHRVTGAADGWWRDLVKHGRANYITGYHPLFVLAKCMARLRRRPPILGSIALLYGFVTGYGLRLPRVNDPHLIRYVRRQQLNRLCGRATIWH
ncbi:MAG: glycosyltransferase family 2 protein [Bryobacterales bacterium]|nr:glycosyltransferase family 2 protein [Bryobacterales bacterium]